MKTTLKKLTPVMMGVLLMTSSCGQTSSQTSSGDKHTCSASCAPGCAGEKEHSCTAACGANCQHKKSNVKSKKSERMETVKKIDKDNELKPFFTATFQYQKDKEPVPVSEENRIGELLGSGEGTITGNRLNGTVHWSIFEIVGAVCETNITGIITTEDGAKIVFDSKGFGTVPDKSQSNKWDMPATVKFSTESKKYDWLNKTFAIWTGGFDMGTGKHTYQAWYSR